MINAKELRIGNCLHTYDGRVVRVTVGVLGEIESGVILMSHPAREPYKPIPLTPEILEKAGFKLDEDDYYSKTLNEDLSIGFMPDYSIEDEPIWPGFTWIEERKEESSVPLRARIQSLHQLQNLILALTGEELTIEL